MQFKLNSSNVTKKTEIDILLLHMLLALSGERGQIKSMLSFFTT